MSIYIVSAVIVLVILINYLLGKNLYREPKNPGYFDNVTELKFTKNKNIAAEPRYIVKISVLIGIAIGIYMAYASILRANWVVVLGMVLILLSAYLVELTKSITLDEETITYTKFLSKKRTIDIQDISGMYIYSFNKKFLKQHAYTTKLVITLKNGERVKLSLSSLDNRAVLNMMKDNFGVSSNKMYIANKKKKA
ncbi:MAG: hypothetical protein IJ215_03205 [Clostridia bacterium]|nr:hypothetical protein [Clostridia bacterium]